VTYFKVQSQNLPGGTVENYSKSHSGYLVSGSGIEPRTPQMRDKNNNRIQLNIFVKENYNVKSSVNFIEINFTTFSRQTG
jgi:hypothetical protein